MTERTLIGQATTNSNGIATLEYTGTGAGDLNIVAVAGDVESNVIQVEDYEPVATDLSIEALTPIVEVGDTVSLKTVLLDQYGEGIPNKSVVVSTDETKFIDKAVTGSKNTNWSDNGASVTTGASNTTVELDYTEYYRAEPLLVGDFEITFNAELSDTIRFSLDSTNKSCIVAQNTSGLYKISRTDGTVLIQRSTDDGVTWSTITSRESDTLTDENCRFRFLNTYNGTRSFNYSDFQMTYYSEYTSNTNSSGGASFSISDLSTSGKYDFIASYGSLTATCTVINSTIYDTGVTEGNKKDYWTTKDNLTVGDDGTLFQQVTSGESFITTTTVGNVSRVWNIPLTAEFDIIDVNGSPQFQIYDGTNYNNWRMSIGHWVFNRDSDGNCTMTKDGVAVNPTATAQTITDVFRIGFQTINNTNYNLKFRNFTVYSTGATGGG